MGKTQFPHALMKLWIKIALLNVFIVVSLGILIGFAMRDVVISSMRSELTRQGESIARNLSDRIADSVLLDDLYKTQEAIEDVLKTEHDIEYILSPTRMETSLPTHFKTAIPLIY